jgi:tetratricopeptide (TPR) repeat protein
VEAAYHYRAARAELQLSHNPQAIRHLLVCMRVWPEDPGTLLLAARAARCAGSFDQAEQLLKKYQKARGLDDAGSFEELLLSTERLVDKQAETCWHRVEQGHPDAPLILEALTRGYLRQFRLVEARQCLSFWKDHYPDSSEAHCLEGLLHLDYEHARSAGETSYRRALELDPDNEDARLGLAVTLLEGESFAEAVEHLERLCQCQPDNLRVKVGVAECREALGEEAEAVRLVDAVLAQQPELPQALALRGRLAVKSGDFAEAETWLRHALARNAMDHRARYNLVLCLNNLGKGEEAAREQRDLEQRETDLGRFNQIVTQDLQQRPRDPALHCELGQLLLRGGLEQEGLRWLQSARSLDPQYAPALQALSEYQQKAKAEHQPADSGH